MRQRSQAAGKPLASPDAHAFAATFPFSHGAMLAGVIAWLIHKHDLHWSGISQARTGCGALSVAAPAVSARPLVKPGVVRLPHHGPPAAMARGTDLAARARCVVSSFCATESMTPAHDLPVNPLDLDCHPTRFRLTLRHAALCYRLRIGNRNTLASGPLVVHCDLSAVKPWMPQHCHIAFDPDGLPICHYLDSLAAGEDAELSGELRLSRARIAAIRLGAANLLVPLVSFWIGSAGNAGPVLHHFECFALTVPATSAKRSMRPPNLDSGLGTWLELTARRWESGEYDELPLDGGKARG